RLEICAAFGADATISLERCPTPRERIEAVRAAVGGFGADVVIECSGHPSAGPEGVEMLRDGGTYVEMGQFTGPGSVETNWHRICAKDVTIVGSWAFTANDIPRAIGLLRRSMDTYPWHLVQRDYPLTEAGVAQAVADADAMKCLKATIRMGPLD